MSSCRCGLRSAAPAHHDRLLQLESDPFGAIAELVGIAATWHELDYTHGEPVLGPSEWVQFAETHTWQDAERIYDLMLGLVSLARVPPGPARLATVTPIDRVRPA